MAMPDRFADFHPPQSQSQSQFAMAMSHRFSDFPQPQLPPPLHDNQPESQTAMAPSQQVPVFPQLQPVVSGNQPQLWTQPGIPEEFMHKNRLHTYAQKLGLPPPLYVVSNEGANHDPLFRVTVSVGDIRYTSQNPSRHRKNLEQEAAKIVLDALLNKIDNEGSPLINQDPYFCKDILNIYANKMHLGLPTYQTTQQQGLVAFTSSLVFKGVTFNGQVALNKRDAEKFAARAAILSILSTPGLDSAIMSNIIKSKYRPLTDAGLYNGSSSNTQHVASTSNYMGINLGSPLDTAREIVTTETTNHMATGAAIENRSSHIPTVQVTTQPHHEFNIPKLDKIAAPTLPIVFVPSAPEQHLGAAPSSSKKRKKKAKNNRQALPQVQQLPRPPLQQQPLPVQEQPPPALQQPLPVQQQPLPVLQQPPPVQLQPPPFLQQPPPFLQQPPPVPQQSSLVQQQPLPALQQPPIVQQQPLPVLQQPPPVQLQPPPVLQQPSPVQQQPLPPLQQPPPVQQQSLPALQQPPPVKQEALPLQQQPPPLQQQPMGAGPSTSKKRRKKGKKANTSFAQFSPIDPPNQLSSPVPQ